MEQDGFADAAYALESSLSLPRILSTPNAAVTWVIRGEMSPLVLLLPHVSTCPFGLQARLEVEIVFLRHQLNA